MSRSKPFLIEASPAPGRAGISQLIRPGFAFFSNSRDAAVLLDAQALGLEPRAISNPKISERSPPSRTLSVAGPGRHPLEGTRGVLSGPNDGLYELASRAGLPVAHPVHAGEVIWPGMRGPQAAPA